MAMTEKQREKNREYQRRFWESKTPAERRAKREEYACNRARRVMERPESEVQEQ